MKIARYKKIKSYKFFTFTSSNYLIHQNSAKTNQ